MFYNGVMYFPDTKNVYANIEYHVPHLEADGPEEQAKAFIMQYTGLKDMNGKEIYEGDIVFEDDGTPDEVIYLDSCYKLKYFGDLLEDCNEYIEVIGNIHENPDLL